MANKDYPFTLEEFNAIYSKIPRLTIELIVKDSKGAIYLTKRDIEPCKGQWHLPGGTVYFGESVKEAANRLATKELGIEVLKAVNKGYIEYPSHYLKKTDHPFGLVFEVTSYTGEIVIDDEASDGQWFTKLPDNMHADQDRFLLDNGYLSK